MGAAEDQRVDPLLLQGGQVLGGGQPARERWLAQPDVVDVDELMTARQRGGKGGPDLGRGEAGSEKQVEELAVGGHPDGQGRGDDKTRPG